MTSSLFLVQMAGMPGSGKSALARVLGRPARAVVIDKDVLKSAALAAGVDEAQAGAVAYEAMFAQAGHMLGQGGSVIMDSPSFWETIPEKGAAIAAGRHVPYYFIECFCPDTLERARRLRDRPRLASHPGEEVLDVKRQTFTPPGPYLRVDTTQSIQRCLELVLDYLGLNAANS